MIPYPSFCVETTKLSLNEKFPEKPPKLDAEISKNKRVNQEK